MIVYADVLILLNFYVDYFLILATEKLCAVRVKVFRRLSAAVVSSLFSLVIFIPEQSAAVNLLIKLVCATVTVSVAFGYMNLRRFIRMIFTFFAASYGFAGIMLAASMVLSLNGVVIRNSAFYCNISPLMLLGATTAFYLLIRLYLLVAKRRGGDFVDISVTYNDSVVTLHCLVDTGNGLRDSVSGCSVAVISNISAKALLGLDGYNFLKNMTPECSKIKGFRLIPYSVIGKKGILPAFKPDEIKLKSNGQYLNDEIYLAVSPTPLRDGVDALIGADLIDEKGGCNVVIAHKN